jgi:proteasome lid subunit RPN8/RPN11
MTENEVAGFGITDPDDLLYVKEFVIIKQKVTCVSFSFEDQAISEFYEEQVDFGRRPEQFSRIWLHSHPGDSPHPSTIDEDTFARVFGSCDWSVMFIIAQDDSTYARLRFNAGPGGEMNIPVCVDCSCEFKATDFKLWKRQYSDNVTQDEVFRDIEEKKKAASDKRQKEAIAISDTFGGESEPSCYDLLNKIDELDSMERDMFLDELSIRSDFWDEESEVYYE